MLFRELFKLSSGGIALAFKNAERVGSQEGFKLLAAPDSQAHFIIALTRMIKGSVQRNLLRRRIKAALQHHLHEEGALPPVTFLCVVYPQALTTPYQNIESWLAKTLKRYRAAHTPKSSS